MKTRKRRDDPKRVFANRLREMVSAVGERRRRAVCCTVYNPFPLSLSYRLSLAHKTQFTLTKPPSLPASNQQLAAAFAPVATRHGIGADCFFEDEGDVAMTKLCAQYRGKIPDEVSYNRDTTNTNIPI